jgi:hypothetical protein
MPLSQRVTFQAMIQKGNKVQIPKMIRWQFKIETDQTLKVTAASQTLGTGEQVFYAKMTKDGRIPIPKLIIVIIKREKPNLLGYVLQITVEPA